jgi:hypothetical protein
LVLKSTPEIPSLTVLALRLKKKRLFYFQGLTNSFQFLNPRKSNYFLALRTLCEKHPGGGYPPIFPLLVSMVCGLLVLGLRWPNPFNRPLTFVEKRNGWQVLRQP